MFFVWGSTVLDDRMQYVKTGKKIRITFEGKTKNKRNQDVNLFRVDVSANVEGKEPAIEGKKDNTKDRVEVEKVQALM